MRVYASNSIYEQETREHYDKPFITHSFITRVANPVLTKIIYQLSTRDKSTWAMQCADGTPGK